MNRLVNQRQRQVLRLEPSQVASAIGGLVLFAFAATASAAAFAYGLGAWPTQIKRPDLDLSGPAALTAGWVLAALAAAALVSACRHLGRWRLAHGVASGTSTSSSARRPAGGRSAKPELPTRRSSTDVI